MAEPRAIIYLANPRDISPVLHEKPNYMHVSILGGLNKGGLSFLKA